MVRTKNKPAIKKPKRLENLKKKTRELSILCGVDACLLYFETNTSDDGSFSGSWHTWPEDQQSCLSLIKKYKDFVNQPINPKKKKKKKKNTREITGTGHEHYQPMQETENHEGNLCLEVLGSDELKGTFRRLNEVHMALEERIQFLKKQTSDQNLKNMALEERIQFLKKQTCDQNLTNDKEGAESELMDFCTCHQSVGLQNIYQPINAGEVQEGNNNEDQNGSGSGNKSKRRALWDLNLEPPEDDEDVDENEMNDYNNVTSNSKE